MFVLLMCTCNRSLFAQDPDNTIFRDDFNRSTLGSAWQAHQTWSIVNGSAYNYIDGTGGTLRTTANYPHDSYIIETTAKGFTPKYFREFRITFGQADLSKEGMYQLKYTAYGGGRLTLLKTANYSYNVKVLDDIALYPTLNAFDWYAFKIAKYKSGLIQVYIDKGSGYGDIPLLEAIDTTYGTLGHVGWQVDTQTIAEEFYVDYISARRPDLEKPAVREKAVEDNLIAQVSAKSGENYKVVKLLPGTKQYIDRDYTITSVPKFLQGASFIQSANNDKSSTVDSFLTFFIKRSAIIYIAYDSRSNTLPAWLNNWTKTEYTIGTSDVNAGELNVYAKYVENVGELYPNPIVLGGNLAMPAVDAKTNYLVAAIEPPDSRKFQAEDALLSGAVTAADHLDFHGTGFADFQNPAKDFIEWTIPVKVPGIYNISFRFANASGEERSLQITDNDVDAGTLSFSPLSSSWSDWLFLNGSEIFLTPGVHKIKLTAMGTSGPNIDELSLSYITTSASDNLLERFATKKVSDEIQIQSFKAYPNPFFEKTKIYYQLTKKAKVILSIYNSQGQLVKALENKIHNEGSYVNEFEAGRVTKGIYIYKLQIGNEVKTGKLIKE